MIGDRPVRWRRGGGVALVMTMALSACGDDDPLEPTLDLDAIAGLYDPSTIQFDPQGSPPEADVLAQIQATQPQLVISPLGGFQIAFLDPISGFIRTPGGVATPTADGVELVFNNQSDADLLLLPRTLTLTFDATPGTLHFTGNVSVPRSRLLQLFPELYADEAFQDPTPGELIVEFDPRIDPT